MSVNATHLPTTVQPDPPQSLTPQPDIVQMWQQLVQQGVLGTARQPTPPPVGEPFVHLWPLTDQQETSANVFDASEQKFLQMAALLTQYMAAARLPRSLDATPMPTGLQPAPLASTPMVADQRAALLRQINREFDQKLLIEWLYYFSRCQEQLPPDLLPALLERSTKDPYLATALAPCLGERGQWLMALNPAWQIDAAASLDAQTWQTGPSAARVNFLEALRADAPAHAREELAAVWLQEGAPDRAAFLATLRINLSAADIPFLEEAVNDRSQQVRAEAVRLLTTIPTAPLRQTILTQLATYLVIERKWLRRQLTVTLPTTFRTEWRQWGLREQSPLSVRIGQKAGWLVQLMTLVPPSALVEALGVDGVELFALIRAGDYAEALITALLEAAENHHDYAFLTAELQHLLRLLQLAQVQQSEFIERFARYTPILPEPERDRLLHQYLTMTERHAFGDWATLQMVVRPFPTLSATVTTRLLTQQLPTLLQRNTRDYGIGRILLDLAYQLDPTGYPHAETLFQRRQGEERPDYVDRFLQIYRLRRQMAQAFGNSVMRDG